MMDLSCCCCCLLVQCEFQRGAQEQAIAEMSRGTMWLVRAPIGSRRCVDDDGGTTDLAVRTPVFRTNA